MTAFAPELQTADEVKLIERVGTYSSKCTSRYSAMFSYRVTDIDDAAPTVTSASMSLWPYKPSVVYPEKLYDIVVLLPEPFKLQLVPRI